MDDTKAAAGPLQDLLRIPASDLKRRGWRGVMQSVRTERAVVITNHDQPEAVILDTRAYADLLDRAGQAESRLQSDLDALRRRFDQRLAVLRKPDAGDRLRTVMRDRAKLRGKVKAGSTF